jgi:two-component system sensor histidine kinase CreC
VPLSDVAHEVVEQCDGLGAKGGGRIRLVLPDTAPTVVGDAFLLRQAVINLVENALDFSPPGGEVELRLLVGAGWVRFEVLDRGPGIPDYARERVFERFYSLPRPGGGSRSSGLGLCFVAEVAALHGGRTTLDNRVGGGAVAVLELPLR